MKAGGGRRRLLGEYLAVLSLAAAPPRTFPSISSAGWTLSSRDIFSWDSLMAMHTAGSVLNLSVGLRENSTKALLNKCKGKIHLTKKKYLRVNVSLMRNKNYNDTSLN